MDRTVYTTASTCQVGAAGGVRMSGTDRRPVLTTLLTVLGCLAMLWVEWVLSPVYPVKSSAKALVFLGCAAAYVLTSGDRTILRSFGRPEQGAMRRPCCWGRSVPPAAGRVHAALSLAGFVRHLRQFTRPRRASPPLLFHWRPSISPLVTPCWRSSFSGALPFLPCTDPVTKSWPGPFPP